MGNLLHTHTNTHTHTVYYVILAKDKVGQNEHAVGDSLTATAVAINLL